MRIVIFASKEKKPDTLSKIIMKRLDCDYSHVGIIFDDVIYHAVGEGVCKADPEKFLLEREYSVLLDVTEKVQVAKETLYG